MYDYDETTDGCFLVEYGLSIVVWMIWYRMLLFRSLDGRTLAESRFILWGLVVACSGWGICCQWESRRRIRDILATQAIAFGVYTILAYMPLRPVLVQGVLAVTAVLALLYVVLIQSQPIRRGSPARVRRVQQFRRNQSLTAVFRTLAVGLAALQGMFLLAVVLRGTVLTARVTATNEYRAEDTLSDDELRTLELLTPETWDTLTAQERLDVLQTVANIEQASLGLPHELNVAAEDVEEDSLCAYYQDDTHQIMVSVDKLLHRSSGFLVEATCHEAYHGYQHRLTELYAAAPEESRGLQILQPAERYTEEFGNYTDGEEDFDTYYSQACERDARSYSQARVAYYGILIGEDLSQQEGDTTP